MANLKIFCKPYYIYAGIWILLSITDSTWQLQCFVCKNTGCLQPRLKTCLTEDDTHCFTQFSITKNKTTMKGCRRWSQGDGCKEMSLPGAILAQCYCSGNKCNEMNHGPMTAEINNAELVRPAAEESEVIEIIADSTTPATISGRGVYNSKGRKAEIPHSSSSDFECYQCKRDCTTARKQKCPKGVNACFMQVHRESSRVELKGCRMWFNEVACKTSIREDYDDCYCHHSLCNDSVDSLRQLVD